MPLSYDRNVRIGDEVQDNQSLRRGTIVDVVSLGGGLISITILFNVDNIKESFVGTERTIQSRLRNVTRATEPAIQPAAHRLEQELQTKFLAGKEMKTYSIGFDRSRTIARRIRNVLKKDARDVIDITKYDDLIKALNILESPELQAAFKSFLDSGRISGYLGNVKPETLKEIYHLYQIQNDEILHLNFLIEETISRKKGVVRKSDLPSRVKGMLFNLRDEYREFITSKGYGIGEGNGRIAANLYPSLNELLEERHSLIRFLDDELDEGGMESLRNYFDERKALEAISGGKKSKVKRKVFSDIVSEEIQKRASTDPIRVSTRKGLYDIVGVVEKEGETYYKARAAYTIEGTLGVERVSQVALKLKSNKDINKQLGTLIDIMYNLQNAESDISRTIADQEAINYATDISTKAYKTSKEVTDFEKTQKYTRTTFISTKDYKASNFEKIQEFIRTTLSISKLGDDVKEDIAQEAYIIASTNYGGNFTAIKQNINEILKEARREYNKTRPPNLEISAGLFQTMPEESIIDDVFSKESIENAERRILKKQSPTGIQTVDEFNKVNLTINRNKNIIKLALLTDDNIFNREIHKITKGKIKTRQELFNHLDYIAKSITDKSPNSLRELAIFAKEINVIMANTSIHDGQVFIPLSYTPEEALDILENIHKTAVSDMFESAELLVGNTPVEGLRVFPMDQGIPSTKGYVYHNKQLHRRNDPNAFAFNADETLLREWEIEKLVDRETTAATILNRGSLGVTINGKVVGTTLSPKEVRSQITMIGKMDPSKARALDIETYGNEVFQFTAGDVTYGTQNFSRAERPLQKILDSYTYEKGAQLASEGELIRKAADTIYSMATKADSLVGHNVLNYDIPMLIRRAEELGLPINVIRKLKRAKFHLVDTLILSKIAYEQLPGGLGLENIYNTLNPIIKEGDPWKVKAAVRAKIPTSLKRQLTPEQEDELVDKIITAGKIQEVHLSAPDAEMNASIVKDIKQTLINKAITPEAKIESIDLGGYLYGTGDIYGLTKNKQEIGSRNRIFKYLGYENLEGGVRVNLQEYYAEGGALRGGGIVTYERSNLGALDALLGNTQKVSEEDAISYQQRAIEDYSRRRVRRMLDDRDIASRDVQVLERNQFQAVVDDKFNMNVKLSAERSSIYTRANIVRLKAESDERLKQQLNLVGSKYLETEEGKQLRNLALRLQELDIDGTKKAEIWNRWTSLLSMGYEYNEITQDVPEFLRRISMTKNIGGKEVDLSFRIAQGAEAFDADITNAAYKLFNILDESELANVLGPETAAIVRGIKKKDYMGEYNEDIFTKYIAPNLKTNMTERAKALTDSLDLERMSAAELKEALLRIGMDPQAYRSNRAMLEEADFNDYLSARRERIGSEAEAARKKATELYTNVMAGDLAKTEEAKAAVQEIIDDTPRILPNDIDPYLAGVPANDEQKLKEIIDIHVRDKYANLAKSQGILTSEDVIKENVNQILEGWKRRMSTNPEMFITHPEAIPITVAEQLNDFSMLRGGMETKFTRGIGSVLGDVENQLGKITREHTTAAIGIPIALATLFMARKPTASLKTDKESVPVSTRHRDVITKDVPLYNRVMINITGGMDGHISHDQLVESVQKALMPHMDNVSPNPEVTKKDDRKVIDKQEIEMKAAHLLKH